MNIEYPYNTAFDIKSFPSEIRLLDHLNGFDVDCKNQIFDHIQSASKKNTKIICNYILDDTVKQNYDNLEFEFTLYTPIWDSLCKYSPNTVINFKNFLCSFNGSDHLSRQFLTSALHKFKYFNFDYCSKNFVAGRDRVDGNLQLFCDSKKESFYRKFIIDDSADATEFYNNTVGFDYSPNDHVYNIQQLEQKLINSFVNVVSETLGTSYYPFVTEKFLYSVVTKGLFVTYGQPGWHEHVEKYYGFKRYTKLFDYRFDAIANPIERLIELISMLSKFSKLSRLGWHDLYLLEKDTIEFNYNHYYSKNYLMHLAGNDV